MYSNSSTVIIRCIRKHGIGGKHPWEFWKFNSHSMSKFIIKFAAKIY